MEKDIQILHNYWLNCQNKTKKETKLESTSFDEIVNSLFSVGDFYYYIIDFYDMSISHVSEPIQDMHGFDPATVTFDNVLETIHPEDLIFVNKAEAACLNFVFNNLEKEKILSYKMSYNFRAQMKNGEYALLNHQALILTLDENGGYGKSLNIHTRVDHLSHINPETFSLIGLNGNPSFLNLSIEPSNKKKTFLTNREIDIIRYISEGFDNKQIAEKLFISMLTVKKHRSNILKKSNCKNSIQLVKNCLLQGII